MCYFAGFLHAEVYFWYRDYLIQNRKIALMQWSQVVKTLYQTLFTAASKLQLVSKYFWQPDFHYMTKVGKFQEITMGLKKFMKD